MAGFIHFRAEKRTGRDSVLQRMLKCVGKLFFFPAESMYAHFKQQIHLTMYSMTFSLTKTIKSPYISTMNAGPVLCTFGLVCFTAQGADIYRIEGGQSELEPLSVADYSLSHGVVIQS